MSYTPTTRVAALATDAIAVIAEHVHGLTLLPGEAELLARSGEVAKVHDALSQRMPIRRAIPGRSPQETSTQQRLIVAEVAAQLSGSFDGRRQRALVGKLVDHESSLRGRDAGIDHRQERIRRLSDVVEEDGAALSAFYRACRRQFSEQRSRLQENIGDSDALTQALARLERLYASYLRQAEEKSIDKVG